MTIKELKDLQMFTMHVMYGIAESGEYPDITEETVGRLDELVQAEIERRRELKAER